MANVPRDSKAPRLTKGFGVRVNEKEHKSFAKVTKPHGGAAPVLRSLIQRVIAGEVTPTTPSN